MTDRPASIEELRSANGSAMGAKDFALPPYEYKVPVDSVTSAFELRAAMHGQARKDGPNFRNSIGRVSTIKDADFALAKYMTGADGFKDGLTTEVKSQAERVRNISRKIKADATFSISDIRTAQTLDDVWIALGPGGTLEHLGVTEDTPQNDMRELTEREKRAGVPEEFQVKTLTQYLLRQAVFHGELQYLDRLSPIAKAKIFEIAPWVRQAYDAKKSRAELKK